MRVTGAIEPVPEESTYKRRSIAQGMPDDLAEPVVTAACFLCCRRAMGEAFTRHSLRPLQTSEGSTMDHSDAMAPREGDVMCGLAAQQAQCHSGARAALARNDDRERSCETALTRSDKYSYNR